MSPPKPIVPTAIIIVERILPKKLGKPPAAEICPISSDFCMLVILSNDFLFSCYWSPFWPGLGLYMLVLGLGGPRYYYPV